MSFRLPFIVWIVLVLVLTGTSQAAFFKVPTYEGITFAAAPGKVYLPLEEAAGRLRLSVQRDEAGRAVALDGVPLPAGSLRTLVDGTELVSTEQLQSAGAVVAATTADAPVAVSKGWRRFTLVTGPQRVSVSLKKQELEAWQGERLVLKTRISSGKNGATPSGEFRAGPYRSRLHRSSLYHNAPMPWSVQLHGHVFIHGFTSVPSYPASHGCVRVPLTGGNPARFIYEWVQSGTPVSVAK